MRNKLVYILLFLAIFFTAPMVWQAFFGLDVSPIGLLLKLPLFLCAGLISLWFINKKSQTPFISQALQSKSSWLQTISISFLLLATLYLLKSVGNVTYLKWLGQSNSNPEIIESLSYIISKPLLALLLVGPFVWFNVLFIEGSRVYFHSYLNLLPSKKWGTLLGLILISFILSSTQLNSSFTQFIGTFITNLMLSLAYFKLKDIRSTIITSIILHSIDLISFWVYS